MFKYKIKNIEAFKDGNVLDGRFVKPGEILVVNETEKQRMVQSGALIEVIETLVPNPLKEVEKTVEPVVEKVEPVAEIAEKPAEKRKAGRPKKVVVSES